MQGWNKKRATMRHYDHQAKVYDSQYLDEQDAKIVAGFSSMGPWSNEFILDMGCGTGILFHHVNEATKLIMGIDISKKLLQVAKKRIKNLSNVNLVRADADNTPFPDKIFTGIFAITLLQNMPDPKTTILEMQRISKSDAVLVLTGLKKKFTQENFIDFLKHAQLKVSVIKTSEHLKDYIVVCKKLEYNV